MANFVSVGDILRGSKLAWELYNLGWNQDLQASTQYNDFGNDVRNLGSNLDAILEVVQNASQQTSRNERRRDAINWDLSSIKEIIGDYERTLHDTRQVLHENKQFSHGRNALVNIEWNINVMPRVNRLRERISFHNSKISILLKPLEIKLLSAIRDDLADVHHDLTEQIGALRRELRGILVPNVDAAIAQQESQETSMLDVPPAITAKFRENASVGHPDFSTSGNIPLQDGADALLRLFKRSTLEFKPGRYVRDKAPSPLQYLNLLKCVWLMQELRRSSEFTNINTCSHWPGYIKQLGEDLSKECQRFTREELIQPALQDLTADDFCIWFQDEVPSILPPSHETVMLEEVLNIPFQPPSHQTIGKLRLLRADTNRYQMIETAEDRIARIPRDDARKSYFSLNSVQLIPLYAIPGSQDALTVTLQTDTTITTLTFRDTKHILKLQHVITGYKAYEYYDQPNVQVTSVFSGSISQVEDGRLQLWLPKDVQGRIQSASMVDTLSASSRHSAVPNKLRSTSLGAVNGLSLQTSGLSASVDATNRLYLYTPPSASEPNASNVSFPASPASPASALLNVPGGGSPLTATARSINSQVSRSSRASVSSISTGPGTGLVHEKPLKPILIMYLKSQDGRNRLSFLTIQIDDMTHINWERCDCRKGRNDCHIAAIERRSGALLAQRYESGHDSAGWNVAAIGRSQRRELPEFECKNLKRISLRFQNPKERETFGGKMCSCNPKVQAKEKDCVLSHQGLFGQVRQIGKHRLEDYHSARQENSRQSIVIGQMLDHAGG
ncbi:hypothetical protein W97_05793 [Coniosporium apollinis CBS 100218]|uniref:Uncharacterized protein n=1 Tax=Coniosporium apollinis (strain CBS 100218) TaxID=1168221 RepID=R7YXG8_CONA1|nr:uncharacterized protein W97_05793 [Coniosporium apollinis CBS 100218]EON66548.1 hypothetical protein W97_05793 [Coniosporium apollinis CBS 100218]